MLTSLPEVESLSWEWVDNGNHEVSMSLRLRLMFQGCGCLPRKGLLWCPTISNFKNTCLLRVLRRHLQLVQEEDPTFPNIGSKESILHYQGGSAVVRVPRTGHWVKSPRGSSEEGEVKDWGPQSWQKQFSPPLPGQSLCLLLPSLIPTLVLILHLNLARAAYRLLSLLQGLTRANILWRAVTLHACLNRDKTITDLPPGLREEITSNM